MRCPLGLLGLRWRSFSVAGHRAQTAYATTLSTLTNLRTLFLSEMQIADGPPYADAYGLKRATELLDRMGVAPLELEHRTPETLPPDPLYDRTTETVESLVAERDKARRASISPSRFIK